MFKIVLAIGVLCSFIAIFFPWKDKKQLVLQYSLNKNEDYYNNLFCTSVGGQR